MPIKFKTISGISLPIEFVTREPEKETLYPIQLEVVVPYMREQEFQTFLDELDEFLTDYFSVRKYGAFAFWDNEEDDVYNGA